MTRAGFKHSKYKPGERVNTPEGERTIIKVVYHSGEFFYEFEDTIGFFAEAELSKTEK